MALYETKQSSLTDVLCKARDCQLKHSDHPLPKTGYTQHLIVAPKGSGKSSVILNLLHNKEGYRGEFDKIYLCSTTAERDPKFDKLVNELSEDGTFYNTLDDGIVQGIMNDIHNELDEHEKRKKKRKEISGLHDVKRVSTFKKEPPPKFCIIFKFNIIQNYPTFIAFINNIIKKIENNSTNRNNRNKKLPKHIVIQTSRLITNEMKDQLKNLFNKYFILLIT